MNNIGKILISEEEVKSKVKELGRIITKDYQGKDLVVIGILKGAVLFLSDLVKEIEVPLSMDFMAISSYGSSTSSSGVVRFLKDLDNEIENKDVLIAEDIIDTGLTLHYLLENLRSRKPRSMKICCFLDKPHRRDVEIPIDYRGFEIPDEFVVGYGLDYAEKYRNLPYIAVLDESQYK